METINQEQYYHWKEEGTITLPDEIIDTFADHYANILRDPHKKNKQEKTKRGRKKKRYHVINHSQTEN